MAGICGSCQLDLRLAVKPAQMNTCCRKTICFPDNETKPTWGGAFPAFPEDATVRLQSQSFTTFHCAQRALSVMKRSLPWGGSGGEIHFLSITDTQPKLTPKACSKESLSKYHCKKKNVTSK